MSSVDQPQAPEALDEVHQELLQKQGMVQRVIDVLEFGLRQSELETDSHYILLHVLEDQAPELLQFDSLVDLCTRLNELRLEIIAEASPKAHWMYVFHGRPWTLHTGRMWHLSDGHQIYDVFAEELPETLNDGMVSVGIPPTDVQNAQRADDDADREAQARQQEQELQAEADDDSAQDIAEGQR